MKLLLCLNCSDVVKLRRTETFCECGLSHGRYINDLDAEYQGEFAYLLGFHNGSLGSALSDQTTYGDSSNKFETGVYKGQSKGREFMAFIIPETASSVKKIK